MESIPQFFEQYAETYQERPFLWEKREGKYQSTTYSEFREHVHRFAAGLKSAGIEAGEKVALLSEGRNDWIMSELGILYNAATCVPLSTKLSDAELVFRLNHAGCKGVIVSAQQFPKLQRIEEKLDNLRRVVLLDDVGEAKAEYLKKDDILAKGKSYLEEHSDDFEKSWKSIPADAFANISYTSGTTSDPKGIVLTHDNYTANARQGCELMTIPKDYIMFIVLPWDHSFAHTAGIYSLMKKGASIASVEAGKTPMETLRNIPKNMNEIRPHMMLSVPSLAKNFKKNIENGIRKKGKTTEKLFNHALKVAYRYNKEGNNKGGSAIDKLLLSLYDKILFSKIRANFGGRLKFFIGGGALLDIDLQRFFYAIGVPMYQGYGLSESSPIISSNAPHSHKLGSSGRLVPEMELTIRDENGKVLAEGEKGEIVIKGPNVMHSYWKNEKATSETIKDGWLYTGDLGYMDEEGFLYVLGRFKSLLISNDGEKHSPEGIEETITEHTPLIDQMILHNNQDPYTIALVHINKEKAKAYAQDHEIDLKSAEGQKKILKELSDAFRRYKADGDHPDLFPERWLPTTFAVLPEGFTEENKMLNSTMKIVRGKINEHYADTINFLYTPEGKDVYNQKNIDVLKKIFE